MRLKILLLAGGILCVPGMAYATGDHPPVGTTPTPTTGTPTPVPTTGTPTPVPTADAPVPITGPPTITPVDSAVIVATTDGSNNSQANSIATSVSGATSSSDSAANSSSGGNSLASAANNSGGNSTTSIDASNRSIYNSRTVFIPSVFPGTPPSQLAVGNIIRETYACGPMQRIVRTRVDGTFLGLFWNTSLAQGWSDDLQPFVDANGTRIDYRTVSSSNGDMRMFGHQVSMFTTVIGVASNRSIALGGGGTGGEWGQAGMGSSSSNQRMVTTIQLRECEIGTMQRVAMEPAPRDMEVASKAIRQ